MYLSTSKRTPESKVIKRLLASMLGTAGTIFNFGNLAGFPTGFAATSVVFPLYVIVAFPFPSFSIKRFLDLS